MPDLPFTPLAPVVPITTVTVAKTYDKFWLIELRLVSPTFDQASVVARLRPFNSETLEMAPDSLDRVVSIGDALAAAQQVPELLTAVNAILTGIAAWQEWQSAQGQPETPPGN